MPANGTSQLLSVWFFIIIYLHSKDNPYPANVENKVSS